MPAIVDEDTFNRTLTTLRSRSPRHTPPRIVNGPTMLAGVARCAHFGAAMIQNTGKGGLYRYYCCSEKMKQGATACLGQRIRMDELDKTVLDYLSGQLFTQERLEQLLASFLSEASQNAQGRKEKLRRAREARGHLDAGLARLLALVERGLMQPDDPTLGERMDHIRLQKAELDREIRRLQDGLKLGTPTLTPDKLDALSIAMRKRLADGPPELQQAYMRLILQSVTVGAHEITLEGPPAALERLTQSGPSSSLPEVLSFAQEWRAGVVKRENWRAALTCP